MKKENERIFHCNVHEFVGEGTKIETD